MALATLFLLVVLTGCGKETAPPTAAAVPPAQPSAAATTPAPVAAASPAAASAAPPAAAVAAPPASSSALATADSESGNGRVEVVELKRIAGDMLILRTAFVNTGHEPMSMARTYTDPHTGDVGNISGLTLVDGVNRKKYFVVRDSGNNCVCSESLNDVKPGERLVAWARFPAPPTDVQKISLVIPHFPPMDDIAIGK